MLATRAKPQEAMWRRVCREAGATVRKNAYLRDMLLGSVLPKDDRKLECLATGLPLWNGAQVAVEATLVSPLKADGTPRPGAARHPGTALRDAKKTKERRYPELLTSGRCKLVVAAMKVGGRWAEEAYEFVDLLAQAKAREAPPALRRSAHHHWVRRWTTLVSVATLRSFADTLLYGTATSTDTWEAEAPTLGELLGSETHTEAPEVSCLPLR